MKKSKIIVPALALIAFSTAASITGTVAWFTASRSATMSLGTYTVASVAKGLSYSLGASGDVGTTDTDHTSVALSANYHLTDGSFDHDAKEIYAPTQDGHALGSTASLTGLTESDVLRATVSSDKYLTAATFTLTVSMEFGQTGNNQALFVDKATSWFKIGGAEGTLPTDTGKAFRLAIVGVQATKVLALGDTATNSKYIKNRTSGGAAASWAAGGDSYASDLIASDTTVTLPSDGGTTTAASGNAGYLGKFTFQANQKVDLTFTCVVWFDGTHAAIENESEAPVFEAVSVQLGLEARSLSD